MTIIAKHSFGKRTPIVSKSEKGWVARAGAIVLAAAAFLVHRALVPKKIGRDSDPGLDFDTASASDGNDDGGVD